MKRLFALLIVVSFALSLYGCSETHVREGSDVTLTFISGDKNIRVALEDDEAGQVIRILDGKDYDPVFSAAPSCGFDKNVSLKVGDRIFAIACDTCNCVLDYGSLRYFEIPQEDMDYMHSLFEKYGGSLPCV